MFSVAWLSYINYSNEKIKIVYKATKQVLFGLFLSQLIILPALSSTLDRIEIIKTISNECLYSSNKKSCKMALEEISIYKSSNSTKENFSCYTRLLGLEAKLLMALVDLNRKTYGIKEYDEIKRICS